MFKKPIVIALTLIIILVLLSLFSLENISMTTNKEFVKALDFITGAIAYIICSIIVILATRLSIIDKYYPQDRVYVLHKDLGILVTIISLLHIFCHDILRPIISPLKEYFKIDILDKSILNIIYEPVLLIVDKSSAKDLGTVIAYIALCLLAITFIQKISYRVWLKTHRLFALLFILLALHVFPLFYKRFLLSPLGALLVIFTVLGTIAALYILLNLHIKLGSRKLKVLAFKKKDNILRLKLQCSMSDFKDHKNVNSRFYFLKVGSFNYHSFTASFSSDDMSISFAISVQGEMTKYLYDNIDSIEYIDVKGPYGNFNLEAGDYLSNRAYIANGVGSIAYLDFIKDICKENEIVQSGFIFILKDKDSLNYLMLKPYLERLTALCLFVDVIFTKDKGRPDTNYFKSKLKGMDTVYFCGSPLLKNALEKDLKDTALKCNFIYEYIRWRHLV